MPLDPQFRKLLDTLAESGALPLTPGATQGSAEQTRAHYRELSMARRGPGYVPEPVASVHDEQLAGPGGPLPVRIYQPAADRGRVVTYLHGGGWVIGDLDTHDPVCRRVSNALGAVVVSVDYRLAPECPYPGPVQDAVAALRWTAEHYPDRTLAVAGDSAGATLAAAAAIAAREDGVALAGQLLLYPATDPSMTRPSYTENAEGYFLTRADMAWFYQQYQPPERDLLHADLTGLAPTVLATAEFCPLRDEGAEYAALLESAGVTVRHIPGPGLIHGYFAFLGVVTSADARSAEVLKTFDALLDG